VVRQGLSFFCGLDDCAGSVPHWDREHEALFTLGGVRTEVRGGARQGRLAIKRWNLGLGLF